MRYIFYLLYNKVPTHIHLLQGFFNQLGWHNGTLEQEETIKFIVLFYILRPNIKHTLNWKLSKGIT